VLYACNRPIGDFSHQKTFDCRSDRKLVIHEVVPVVEFVVSELQLRQCAQSISRIKLLLERSFPKKKFLNKITLSGFANP
jgi:hypothetical protein